MNERKTHLISNNRAKHYNMCGMRFVNKRTQYKSEVTCGNCKRISGK